MYGIMTAKREIEFTGDITSMHAAIFLLFYT
jgi:hypothetical protein